MDSGNNVFGATADQRNQPRVSRAAADIGARELQRSDIVFGAGFDGCPYDPTKKESC
jgi:hypothetical protein